MDLQANPDILTKLTNINFQKYYMPVFHIMYLFAFIKLLQDFIGVLFAKLIKIF